MNFKTHVNSFLTFLFVIFIIPFHLFSQNDQQIENKINAIIQQLTLEEKIDMLHAKTIFSSGGVERLGIPDLQYADGPLGIREETQQQGWEPLGLTTDSATYFPSGTALAATWNPDLALKCGIAIGEEARARNKDVLLAPSINIIRTPLSGRNYEFFTEDPYLNSVLAVNYIKGVQSQDVAACVKHYAVNNQEMSRWNINVDMNERALREIYLPAFKAAVTQANVYSIMGAYNKFRGYYCCESQYLLNDILRAEWGFKGFVVSDWGATHSTVNAANTGLDVEMGMSRRRQSFFGTSLLDSVKAGLVAEKTIDDKVRTILYVMHRCKMMDPDRKKGVLNIKEHYEIAYQIASEAVVLLKNSNNLLPLKLRNVKTIAVIGANAKRLNALAGFGAGVKTKYEITPFQGLKNRIGKKVELKFTAGYAEKFKQINRFLSVPSDTVNLALIEEAVDLAKSSDIAIIFAGSNRQIESEARDRTNLSLPFGQEKLISEVVAANPKTVVVMIAAAPHDLRNILESVSTLVWGWYNGSEGGNAIADVLIGKVNPSGKLPFTMPVKLEDSPAHALNAYDLRDSTFYKEGILVGYRWFDTKNIDPLYCFGYGLSYTTFEYSSLKLDKRQYKKSDTIHISLTIKNTGKQFGAETAQVYVKDIESSVIRPVKELKGFKKIFLKPGQKETITIPVKVSDFAYYDDNKMEWIVELGEFEIMVGASSRDIKLTKKIHVE